MAKHDSNPTTSVLPAGDLPDDPCCQYCHPRLLEPHPAGDPPGDSLCQWCRSRLLDPRCLGCRPFAGLEWTAAIRFEGVGVLTAKTPKRFKPVEVFDDFKQRRGRPPEYDREAIIKAAEDLIKEKGVDDRLDWFVERTRDALGARHIKAPGDTVLTEICAPLYKRAKATE